MSILGLNYAKNASDWAKGKLLGAVVNDTVKITFERNMSPSIPVTLVLEFLDDTELNVIDSRELLTNATGLQFTFHDRVHGKYRLKIVNDSPDYFYLIKLWVHSEYNGDIPVITGTPEISAGTIAFSNVLYMPNKNAIAKKMSDFLDKKNTITVENANVSIRVTHAQPADNRISVILQHYDNYGNLGYEETLLDRVKGNSFLFKAAVYSNYRLKLVNNTTGTGLYFLVEIRSIELSNVVYSTPNHVEASPGISWISPLVAHISTGSQIAESINISKSVKVPDRSLIFKKSNEYYISVMSFSKTKSSKNILFLGNTGGLVRKLGRTSSLLNQTDLELGVDWNAAWGTAKKIVEFCDDTFVVFTDDFANPATSRCKIWKFDSITDAAPVNVYTSPNLSWWAGDAFGIKSETNGLSTFVLAGEYGQTSNSKDLLSNSDNGTTWYKIYQTGSNTGGRNAHFHDVNIDMANGLLWCSIGDFEDFARIHLSDDFGASWYKANPDITTGVSRQPTLIMSFPNRIIFGHDSGTAGFSIIENPKTTADWKYLASSNPLLGGIGLPKPFFQTRSNYLGGEQCYLNYPYQWGTLEGICVESPHGDYAPNKIYMTGDGGYSFHTVSAMKYDVLSRQQADKYFYKILGMDDKYVYVSQNIYGLVLVAEKPIFI